MAIPKRCIGSKVCVLQFSILSCAHLGSSARNLSKRPFRAQHILDPANNSSWAWHTVAAMLAIWDYPKSWAHLATLPFPKPEELSDAQKICWTHMT